MEENVSLSGEIKDMTIPWLFQGLNAEKKTGTVVCEKDETVKKVYFSAGEIVFASSNRSEDRLSEWLVQTNIISRQQSDETSVLFHKTGKKEGSILVELGILSPTAMVEGVQTQVKQIIVSLFNWREGRFMFDESPLPSADIIPLKISTGNYIIEGLRGLEWKVIRKSLPSLRTIIRPSADPSLLFQGVDLDQDHWAIFSLIDGMKSIEDICGLSGIGDFNTLKAIYVLLALRMVEAGELKTEEERKFVHEVVRETIPPKDEKSAEPTIARSITKEELIIAYKNLGWQNHYEVLGIKQTATVTEVKKAYFTLAKLYHPDRHFKTEMSEMKETLETLFSSIHDAYEILSNQSERDQYDLLLARRDTAKTSAEERERGREADSKENAAVQYQEGIKRFKAGDFWGAEEAFRWAMRLDSLNAEYVFRRAQALARIPRRGHDAEGYFTKAIKMAPERIEYYLELGNLYERNGLKTKALTVYRNALRYGPNTDRINQAIKRVSG
ncbi:MAG TPA: DUF4388 domain-containing protein [Nitrospirota bacterium]|nr:DUF4388 domain-containing protein [Nitrospirota bacterium]